jgi:hypothetical protein
MKRLLLVYVLTLTFLLLITACIKEKPQNFSDGQVDFVAVDKVPVVKGTLNGKEAYFIIDSGASLSVLDKKQSNDYKFNVGIPLDINISGYGGESTPNKVSGVDIIVGGIDFNGTYRTQDITNIVSVIKDVSGVKIVGIIGSNIMKPKGLIIDYSTNSLYIKDFVTIQKK